MKVRTLATTVALLLCVAGCTSTHTHVVIVSKSTTPPSPAFTVIPIDLSAAELEQAARIQSCLISAGRTVVERPAISAFETTVETDREPGSDKGRAGFSTDIVASFDGTDAEIIVVSDHANRRVRVLNSAANYQVVLSERYAAQQPDSVCSIVAAAIHGLDLGGAL